MRENHWWCNFARYGDKNGETFWSSSTAPGRNLPLDVSRECDQATCRNSISGGIWYQHQLLVTGHDDGVFFVLDFAGEGNGARTRPHGSNAVHTGIGFAYDSATHGLIGIDRKKRELVMARLDPSQPLRCG